MTRVQTWTCADCPLDENGEHIGDAGPFAHDDGEKHERETGHVVWYDEADGLPMFPVEPIPLKHNTTADAMARYARWAKGGAK